MSRGRRLAHLQPAPYVGQLVRRGSGVGIVRAITQATYNSYGGMTGTYTAPVVEWASKPGQLETLDTGAWDDLDTYIADVERQCNAATELRQRAEAAFRVPARPAHP